ncbi:hypothetical protein DJ522_07340, partial [Sulfolobus sp. F3]
MESLAIYGGEEVGAIIIFFYYSIISMLGYYMFPDVRGNLLAFTSDDDIWLLNLERKDNRPIRLTSGLG